MKLFKKVSACLVAALMLASCVGCDEEEIALAAKSIRVATNFALTEVFEKNPDVISPVCQVAFMNKDILEKKEIDVQEAVKTVEMVLGCFEGLDAESQDRIIQLLQSIIPVIDLPKDGELKEPQTTFLIAFFDGILDACNFEFTREPEEPVIEWEIKHGL